MPKNPWPLNAENEMALLCRKMTPHNGLVVGLKVSSGEHLGPDQSLFTLINTDQWYATALFRETDLASLRIGQCSQAYVLADPTRHIQGRIVSIGWGVANEDLIALPRSLPYVQKSLNWVRVAQRFPVRVLLENPPEELMRAGASASVVVRTNVEC
jgi:multidrug efflux system membrane fusion protein